VSELAAILGNAGDKFEILYNNRSYKAKLIDQQVKDGFSKKLLGIKRDALFELKSGYSYEEYLERLDKLSDDFLMGEFDLVSKLGQKSLGTPAGMLHLCSLIFDIDEMEMMRLMADRKDEVLSLLQLILKLSLPQVTAKKDGEVLKVVPPNPVQA
jgi:hypothetical protein